MGTGYAPFLLQPWRDEYVTTDAPQPVATPPQATGQASPALAQPQPQSSGDVSFWGGLLDVLRNVPLQGGGKRSQWQLPSFNEMTAGRRLVDFGRSQGLDLPQVSSVSPREGEFMYQAAAKRRLDDPLGMDVAQQLIPPALGEPPETMTQRAWIARLPRSALAGLVAHQVQQYGLPGWGGETPIDIYASLKGLPDENAPAPPPPATTPAPPSGVQQGPAPALGTAAMPAPTAPTAPSATSVAPAPPPAPSPEGAPVPTPAPVAQAAPAAAPQAVPSPQPAPGMPEAPIPPVGGVTKQQVLRHPTVTAAQAAYDASRTRQEKQQNAAALRNALATAPAKIQQEQHQRYVEQTQAYRNTMEAQKFYLEVARAPYGYGTDVDAQIRMDYNSPAPGDPRLPAMARASEPRAAARLAENKAREAAATKTATMMGEYRANLQLPIEQTMKNPDVLLINTSTLEPLPGTTLGAKAAAMEDSGQARLISRAELEEARVVRQAASIMARGRQYIEKLYSIAAQPGYLAKMTPEERRNPIDWLLGNVGQLGQDAPEVIEAQRFFQVNSQVLARGIAGGKGVLNAQEMESATASYPNIVYKFNVGRTLMNVLGFRIPGVAISVPDTRETALSTMDMTMQLLNDHARRISGNPDFTFAGLTPRGEAQKARERDEQARQAERAGATQQVSPYSRLPLPAPIKAVGEVAHVVGEKVKEFVSPQAPVGPTGAPVPSMPKLKEIALRQMGIKQAPAPQDAPGFKTYMDTLHTVVKNNRRDLTPVEQAQLITLIAQKLGGTWQPPQ
jgi:hypothetical protein